MSGGPSRLSLDALYPGQAWLQAGQHYPDLGHSNCILGDTATGYAEHANSTTIGTSQDWENQTLSSFARSLAGTPESDYSSQAPLTPLNGVTGLHLHNPADYGFNGTNNQPSPASGYGQAPTPTSGKVVTSRRATAQHGLGLRGVTFVASARPHNWKATINHNGNVLDLGYYGTELEAAKVREIWDIHFVAANFDATFLRVTHTALPCHAIRVDMPRITDNQLPVQVPAHHISASCLKWRHYAHTNILSQMSTALRTDHSHNPYIRFRTSI